MTESERREQARQFIQKWHGKGREDEDDRSYWLDILQRILGMDNATDRIDFQKKVIVDGNTKKIDAYIPETRVLIEQKSLGVALERKAAQSGGISLTPYEQAKRYNDNLPYDEKARWIIISNFAEIWVYDMNARVPAPQKFSIENMQNHSHFLDFIMEKKAKAPTVEEELSKEAGKYVGRIYDAFIKQYNNPDSAETQKSLNILCVRLVFCLYAEDAGLFRQNDSFSRYIGQYEPKDIRRALIDLFEVLDTPEDSRKAMYLSEELASFPYVNGGLFAIRGKNGIEIPQITEEIKQILLESAKFDWSGISPTIFGAVFESTLNPDTRRKGGMHYTSIENIHKAIDSLFLDELKAELDEIGANVSENTTPKQKKENKNQLLEFQNKLSSLKFLDPACGSGNFLTETYLSLRRLENEAVKLIYGNERLFGDIIDPIKVHISQFYGIEVNDFAVAVAKTALWIAESQMMRETEDIMQKTMNFLPLKTNANIVEGNALRLDWSSVVSPNELNYIMGNPPFVGARLMTKAQKDELLSVFGENWKNIGNLDYVAGWYKKAAEFMSCNSPHPATYNPPTPSPSPTRGEGSRGNSSFDSSLPSNGLSENGHNEKREFVFKNGVHFYSKAAFQTSRELKSKMTSAEQILWEYLRDRQLNGFKFRRQQAFGMYILDFVCYEQKLAIELDGDIHTTEEQKKHDIARDAFITENGLKVIRFSNDEVKNNIGQVLVKIMESASLAPCGRGKEGEGNNAPSPLVGEGDSRGVEGNSRIKAALVSTNSITQGEQAAILWKPLFESGIHIDFAWRTFRWDSESSGKAHVHCVIIGFSCTENNKQKTIYDGENRIAASNINAYLIDADDIFVESRQHPLCEVPEIGIGNKPIDGGFYLFTEEEKNEFLKKEPSAAKYFHSWVGSEEFINGKKRYCLWLGDCSPSELRAMPRCMERIKAVREYRLASKSAGTRRLAEKPTRFHVENMPNENYILIPETSSENRRYVPIGFLTPETICSNAVKIIPGATLYHFGILTSNVHNAWMRAVCGRLEMRYRYSKDIVYNNFPWPECNEKQKAEIEKTAQMILDARKLYPKDTLADLYDPLTMPPELLAAHRANDKTVMQAYGLDIKTTSEPQCVAFLMKRYREMTEKSLH